MFSLFGALVQTLRTRLLTQPAARAVQGFAADLNYAGQSEIPTVAAIAPELARLGAATDLTGRAI